MYSNHREPTLSRLLKQTSRCRPVFPDDDQQLLLDPDLVSAFHEPQYLPLRANKSLWNSTVENP